MTEKVNFVDLRASHDEVRTEIDAALRDIIDRSSFVGGHYVAQFEQDFAGFLGVKEAIAVGNGTDALWLGLHIAGVGPGDAVITVPNTFIATTEAITRLGAVPVLVDIDPGTCLMDVDLLGEFLENECELDSKGRFVHKQTGRRIAALLPVHLYGQLVDMAPLMQLAKKYGVPVIEDACQAHGARYRVNGEWVRAGNFGQSAAFSFYPGKNLGAMGDAGALVTNDPDVAEQARWLRDHGSSKKYIHVTPHGWNSRMDAIQAAVLSIKLRRLDDWNAARRAVAEGYAELLSGLPLELPVARADTEHVYHLYVVHTEDREALQAALQEEGIYSGLHYPIPLHLQEAYAGWDFGTGSFPHSERSARKLLSLPMHPHLTEEELMRVANVCRDFYAMKISGLAGAK